MTTQLKQEALSYLKSEGKIITRKHVSEHGFTMFEHPSHTSCVIMVKNNKIVGQTNKKKICSNNSDTQYILENEYFLEFTI